MAVQDTFEGSLELEVQALREEMWNQDEDSSGWLLRECAAARLLLRAQPQRLPDFDPDATFAPTARGVAVAAGLEAALGVSSTKVAPPMTRIDDIVAGVAKAFAEQLKTSVVSSSELPGELVVFTTWVGKCYETAVLLRGDPVLESQWLRTTDADERLVHHKRMVEIASGDRFFGGAQ